MRWATYKILTFVLLASFIGARPVAAADQPFDAGLMRLAEILGSLHFLRNLCGEQGDQWRELMDRLLSAEKPEEERRARFVANFNRGYRSFEGTYTTCTASATEAIGRYTVEGESLARELAARYGN